MKNFFFACIGLFLASCTGFASSQTPASPSAATETKAPLSSTLPVTPTVAEPTPIPTQTPVPTATPNLVSTIVASGPLIAVNFDGATCTAEGPTEIPLGSLVLKFTNTTGETATPWVNRNYPGKTWQDVLDYIGAPGSYVPDIPDWIAFLFTRRSATESPTVSYRQFDLTIAGEYAIVVEMVSDILWPCGPFLVK